MSSAKKFDVIVIGSGQGGTPAATAFAKAGRPTALIERIHVAGTCINEGCTPTKTMIASGIAAHAAHRAQDYGVWKAQSKQGKDQGKWESLDPAVDMLKVRQRKRDIVESWRGGSEARVKNQENLDLIMGEATFKDPKTLSVKLLDGGNAEVTAETIIINTGERPNKPKIPGLETIEQARVLDSTSVMEVGEVPEHLIVLGGGYIGLEFGQLFGRLGSQVTILQKGKQLVPREDPEVADAVREVLEGEGIKVLLNTAVANVTPGEDSKGKVVVSYKDAQGNDASVNGSHLLLAIGRTPNTDTLNLEAAGVKASSRGYIQVDEKLQTSASHIWAIGDVKGPPAFTHVSYDDFRILRSHLLPDSSPKLTITDRIIPYCCFIDPQLGHVGLHENEARAKFPNATIKTASMPMAYVARALEMENSAGLMKAVVNGDTGQILGFTCFGMEGGEITAIVQTAMLGKLHYKVLQEAMYSHPTLAESLNNLWGYLK